MGPCSIGLQVLDPLHKECNELQAPEAIFTQHINLNTIGIYQYMEH